MTWKNDSDKKAWFRAYYLKHRERLLADRRNWRKAHPEECRLAERIYMQRRRVRLAHPEESLK
jgi:hypothetical protein